ncbi:hypothetical protein AB0J74_03420 [Asanoa sp. NPDC049573]|uniref:hypothetical protein n=1 Tax=Asanoa sp. NPDC049573 TaxID=3155396 RepID=UPI00343FCD4D
MNRMAVADEAAFHDHVSARMPGWRRMCRDWHLADDLVATTLFGATIRSEPPPPYTVDALSARAGC